MAPSRNNKANTAACPSISEILASVWSLLQDDLQPCVRVLLKRIRERAADSLAEARGLPKGSVDLNETPFIDAKVLRKACMHCWDLVVESKEATEYSVMPRGAQRTYIDVCSQVDKYSAEMWEEFGAYLSTLSAEDLGKPTGRYECARVLMQKDLPFFQGFSLGAVCHVVHLAVCTRRLLGYSKGALVPHKFCDAVLKETCALKLTPLGDGSTGRWATWDDLVPNLVTLLGMEEAGISISNVKPYYQSHFQAELSETALGHKRLQDVLQDPRVAEKVVLLKVNGSIRAALRPEVRAEEQQRMFAEQLQIARAEETKSLAAPPGNWSLVAPVAPGQWNVQQSQQTVALPPLVPMLNLATVPDPALQEGPLLSPGATPRTPVHQVKLSESLMQTPLKLADKECDAQSDTTASEASEDSADTGYLSLSGSFGDSDLSPQSAGAGFVIDTSDYGDAAQGQLSVKNTFIEFSLYLDEFSSEDASPTRRRARSVPRISRAA